MANILADFNCEYDSGDPFGSVMRWWFAVCEELTRRGEDVPASWNYRPGALGVPNEPEDGEDLTVYSVNELRSLGMLLDSFHDVIVKAGLDY